MESGAKGCEVTVSGKMRGQRAKSMKFRDGYMIKSGQPVRDYIDESTRHVFLRQGILGVKVAIMLPHDPSGRNGPKKPQPDVVKVRPPKEDDLLPTAASTSTSTSQGIGYGQSVESKPQQQQQQQQQQQ